MNIENNDQVTVIGAHWDTVPGSPGVGDNGSGLAALLEVNLNITLNALMKIITTSIIKKLNCILSLPDNKNVGDSEGGDQQLCDRGCL